VAGHVPEIRISIKGCGSDRLLNCMTDLATIWCYYSFSLLPCPDRLWVPPSLLCNGYRGLLPRK